MKTNYTHSAFSKIFTALFLLTIGLEANATKHIITVQDFSFSPSSLSAALGDTIEWDWITGSHTTTSGTIPVGAAIWDHPLNSQDGNGSFTYVPAVAGTYNYKCTIHESFGMIASFTVSGCTPPTAQQAAITAGGATTFCKGGNVVLSVAASGFNYQWKKGSNNVAGATQQSYTVSKGGTYKCVVSNGCGSATSNSISVTVNPQPTSSVSQSPCSNGAILLTCTFTPSTGVTFQWKKGTTNLSGATNSTYSATSNGKYKCTVTITATGCTKSSAASSVTISCRTGDVVSDNGVIVYPNPSSNYFNINTSKLDPQSIIGIYDFTGRLLESYNVNSDEMQVGETLSNGIYLLKITSNSNPQQVIKLVKNF